MSTTGWPSLVSFNPLVLSRLSLPAGELICIAGLDTTATELSVIESVFKLGEGMGPSAINTINKDTMVESFY